MPAEYREGQPTNGLVPGGATNSGGINTQQLAPPPTFAVPNLQQPAPTFNMQASPPTYYPS